MITRRKSRRIDAEEVVEVVDVVENEDLPSPSESFPSDVTAGMELDDLFGIEDLRWTLEADASSSNFDICMAELGAYSAEDQDSSIEASVVSSPERVFSDTKIRNRQNQSISVGNKNAIAARLNRLKKKEYVNSLEEKVGVLSMENETLKEENSQLLKRVEELEDETRVPNHMTTTMPYPGNT